MTPDADDAEPFGTWLVGQSDKQGWISELAKAAKADSLFPRDGGPDAVRAHLSNRGADGDMFEAVDDAEGEWLRS
jgi:hypothetical protein